MIKSRGDMRAFDVIVIGGGVMGAATACEVARRGHKVALIDQARLPNPRAASIDHSKVFRFAYPDALYARLAVDALRRWQELEQETGARLLTKTGLLMIATESAASEDLSYETLLLLGLEVERLDSHDVARRYPQFNPDAFSFAISDPSGAILHAERAVGALVGLASRLGVTIIENHRVTDVRQAKAKRVSVMTQAGDEFICERLCVASGPWTRKLLPVLSQNLATTRQEVVYFEPVAFDKVKADNFEIGAFPIFIELESGFYGFPVHHAGAMKIANHHKGELADPDLNDTPVKDEFIRKCRDFFSEFIPRLASAEAVETRTCFYNNTPDDDFIIDWHPEIENALIVTGFSGHGFKFGPAIGSISADVLLGVGASFDLSRFSLTRFYNKD